MIKKLQGPVTSFGEQLPPTTNEIVAKLNEVIEAVNGQRELLHSLSDRLTRREMAELASYKTNVHPGVPTGITTAHGSVMGFTTGGELGIGPPQENPGASG